MATHKLFTKNFALLFFGQISSLFGNGILRFALSMYILEITGSATIFASILAIAMIPTILLSPLGGILADRANRRNIMVALDFLSGLVVLFALIAISAQANVAVISFILIALSILGAFESPTVQAAVPQMQHESNLVRANAVVIQVAAVSGLAAPLLGGALYASFGLRPVMIVTIVSFFATAFLECFIKLPFVQTDKTQSLLQTIKGDFKISMDFICKKQPDILKLLFLVAAVSFFLMGVATVGLPFIIRNILGLSSQHYGAAESLICASAIIGSILAGLLTAKLPIRKLHIVFSSIGIAMLPAGIVFLFNPSALVTYGIIIASMCLIQMIATIFSIYCMSIIQQKTPNALLGKTMAYVSTISMCTQPLGQILYGFLFDIFHTQLYIIIIPTALIITLIGILAKKSFSKLDNNV